ncbi:MAG: hypothetical protein B6D64_03075 [Bacteroidetes bacterium 4484_276]|nr:MAG: hypothetical protein B6D64_03075 [Bacteroidetes bacterium 4484_276]OYT13364.1 MAG: hypothetical protein B6I19_05540 [Bacteroidetes bacterium 4572_114]
MKKKYDVAVVGELNVDIILNHLSSLPSIGDKYWQGRWMLYWEVHLHVSSIFIHPKIKKEVIFFFKR